MAPITATIRRVTLSALLASSLRCVLTPMDDVVPLVVAYRHLVPEVPRLTEQGAVRDEVHDRAHLVPHPEIEVLQEIPAGGPLPHEDGVNQGLPEQR